MTGQTPRPFPQDRRAPERFPLLDGVRGIAVLMVIVSHCANAGLLPRWLGQGVGEMGVCLFFILSGFLMSHLYLEEAFEPEAVARYARQRIGRVFPLYYAILAVCLLAPAGLLWLYPVGDTPLQHLLMGKGVSVLWTIPVEVQFYLVFVSIWWLRARGLFLPAIALWAAAGAALAVVLFLSGSDWRYLAFWLHFFLFGTLVGFAYRHHRGWFEAVRWPLLGWLAPVVLLAAFPELRRMAELPTLPTWIDPVSAGAPTLFFLAALLGLGPLRALGARPLRWIGKVSYAAYLFHLPVLMTVLSLAEPASPLVGALLFGLVLAVTFAMSALSFEGFERPAQRLVGRLALPSDAARASPARLLRSGSSRPRRG